MEDKTIETVQKAVDDQFGVAIGLAIAISVLTFFVTGYFDETVGESPGNVLIAPSAVVGLLGIVVGTLHGLVNAMSNPVPLCRSDASPEAP